MKKILLSVFMYSTIAHEFDRIDVNHLLEFKENKHDKEEKTPLWEVKLLEEKSFEITAPLKRGNEKIEDKEIIETFIQSLKDKNIQVISYEVIKN